jgi:hypothetical protein
MRLQTAQLATPERKRGRTLLLGVATNKRGTNEGSREDDVNPQPVPRCLLQTWVRNFKDETIISYAGAPLFIHSDAYFSACLSR